MMSHRAPVVLDCSKGDFFDFIGAVEAHQIPDVRTVGRKARRSACDRADGKKRVLISAPDAALLIENGVPGAGPLLETIRQTLEQRDAPPQIARPVEA